MSSPPEAHNVFKSAVSFLSSSRALSYLQAVLIVGGILCLKLYFLPPGTSSPALLFFAAVMLSAWQGGLGPGWLATLLSALALNYFFLTPYGQFNFDGASLAQTFILLIEGSLISLLANARRRAKHHAREEWQRARDETERAVAAELRILDRETLNRTVLDSLPAHIAVLDKEGNIVSVNIAWEKFGLHHHACVLPRLSVGENYLEPSRHPDAAKAVKGIRALLAGEQEIFAMEYSCKTNEGERWYSLTVAPLVTNERAAGGAVVSHLDISERKEIELERSRVLERERTARAIAEDANRSKDEFLAIVSHELRTPLNSILGWTQLLSDGNLDDAATRQGLSVIERNVRTQSHLINDLLDVSRIVTNKMLIEPQPLSLQQITQNAIDITLPFAQEQNITVITDFQSDPQIYADPHRLQQVLWNLLHNAVKFSTPGEAVVITLGTKNEQAELTISDNGVGISPEFLSSIFDRFRQADGTPTRRHGGLGLGLAISKHLIELHQGTLVAASAGEGQGATFTISLPLLHPEQTQASANENCLENGVLEAV
jgi:PAS domain S-box-containing protein